MSPTYILIDQGNSRLKIALATDEQLYPTRLYPEPPTSDQLLELMHSYQLPARPLYAIYSSVGEREAPWLGSIQSVCQLFVTLDAETPLPLAEVQYDRKCLGVDRVASVVGVAQLTTEPSLVIDIGTAITYDLLLPEKRYMGATYPQVLSYVYKHCMTTRLGYLVCRGLTSSHTLIYGTKS